MNLIITHENGDFDALAAVVAAAKLYPGSIVLMPDPLQANVRSFVNLYRDLLPLSDPKDITEGIDSVVIVDTNRKERLGKWQYLLDRAKQIIVYDHHPGEEDLGADYNKIEQVGSTTTILLEEINEHKARFTEFEATLFALGIYEDTGCLTYNITTDRDARALASLWETGLNIKLIQEYLHTPLTDSQKNLLEKLFQNSELCELNQRRVLISTTVIDEYVVGAAVLIQLLDEIEDAGLTIIIVQMEDNVFLAARSRDSDLDLLELMAPFDVKGYPESVSAHIKGRQAEQIKKQVIEFLEKKLPPVVTIKDVASKPVFSMNSDTTLDKAEKLLNDRGFKGCPVTEDDQLVGMISHRDIRKGLRSDLGHAPVKGFMTRELITASPDHSLIELRRLMVEHNIGRVPIVNSENQLVGIVTRSDILRHLNLIDRSGRSLKSERTPETANSRLEKSILDQPVDKEINILPLINSELPVRMQKILLQISHTAARENVEIYLVGGIIRDLLLRYPPEKDLDFVVIGDAIDFAFTLQKIVNGNIRYYEKFGTASIYLEDGLRLDLVTARKEFYNSPAALPQVKSSSLKNDLFRRDFTINTMACSLTGENYGKLLDYYSGRLDLQNKVIRVLNKLSFVDDPLRILRSVRFEQRFNFTIEPDTMKLINKAVERKVIEKVSRQRLNQELKLCYNEPSPPNILKRFDDLKLFPFLYPRVNPDQKTWQLLFKIDEVIKWVEQRDWKIKPDVELVYLSGLLLGLESVERSAIIRKLYLSKDRASVIYKACREVPVVKEKLDQVGLNPSEVVNCLETLPVEAILLAYASAEQKIIKDHLKLYMEALQYMRPKLKGSDLKKIGLEPGPHYRKIIENLKQAHLDGEVRTPQEELNYVIEYLEKERGKEE